MKEVSCRALEVVWREAARRGADDDALFEGVEVPRWVLRDSQERIDWAAYCRFLHNAARYIDDQGFVTIGLHLKGSRLLAPLFLVARLLFTTREFYAWANSPRGSSNMLFSCVHAEERDLAPGHLEMRLVVEDDKEVPRPFLLIVLGALQTMPRILGFPLAEVTMQEEPQGARYDIHYAQGGGALSSLRKAILRPFELRAAGQELKKAHEALSLRYAELEKTRGELVLARDHLEERVEERTAELEQARAELAESLRRERASREVKDRILANLNHEVRTPLTSIALAAEALAEEGDGPSEDIAAIKEAGTELLHLFDDLLASSTLDQSAETLLRSSVVDLGRIVERQLTIWRPAYQQAGVALLDEGDAHRATGDERALARVLSNLLSNALKFTAAGGTVVVRREERGDRVVLCVEDDGVGLSEGAEERVFERFEKDRPPLRSANRGVGIGLSLVKDLVERMGGQVAAERRPAGGSQFRVELPVHSRRADPPEPASTALELQERGPHLSDRAEAAELPERTGGGHRPTILLAEDDGALRAQLAALLRRRYRVLTASDGATALELAEEHRPDLLLSDVEMPGLSGFELCKRFRQTQGLEHAPAILISAHGLHHQKLAGFLSGASDYVVKPVQPAEVLARVEVSLERTRAFVRLHQAELHGATSTLVSGLSHELRNPANALVNAIPALKQSLLARGELSDKERKLFDAMELAGEQLSETVTHLLGSSRGRVQKKRHSLVELAERAAELTRRAGYEAELEVEVSPALAVEAAGPLVVQLLVNLLANGSRAAGEEGRVTLRAASEGEPPGWITLHVTDTGPGVPASIAPRIFEPFFSTHLDTDGTGLGLFTARRLAELHSGTLELGPGRPGAHFALTLPAAPPRAPARAGPPAPRPEAAKP